MELKVNTNTANTDTDYIPTDMCNNFFNYPPLYIEEPKLTTIRKDMKMDVIEKGKNIVKEYKTYVNSYYSDRVNQEINELTQKSKVQKIFDEANDLIKTKLQELDNSNFLIDYVPIVSLESYFTEEEKELEKKICKKYEKVIDSVIAVLDRVITSIDLCETREEVMGLLKQTGFVDEFGVVIDHKKVKGYIK